MGSGCVLGRSAQKRAGFRAEAPYRAVLVLGALLFFIPAHGYVGRFRLWFPSVAEAWICVVLVAIGLAFSWWARLHLGRLWSGTVTAKAEHRVIDTGPYRLVRHPIYTGLLLASSPPWRRKAPSGASPGPFCSSSASS